MRIALYARHVNRRIKTGLEVLAEEVVGRLVMRPGDWTLISPRGTPPWAPADGRARTVSLSSRSSVLPLFSEISRVLRRESCEVFYNPGQYVPYRAPCPTIATGLDVAWRYFPDYFPAPKRAAFELLTRHACRSAARLIAISRSTRDDLVRLFGCREDKVVVAYPGVDHEIFHPRPAGDETILEKHGLRTHGYILYLGTLQKRKNITNLVRGFGRMKEKGYTLVLAGSRGWYYDEIAQEIARSPRRGDIREMGYVAAEERPALYRNAACSACVSLYEGFGFPVAESMACGCPAVIARVSSLPEIAGTVGWQADPRDEEEIGAALDAAVLKGPEPSLRESARERALLFDWSRSVSLIYDVMQELS